MAENILDWYKKKGVLIFLLGVALNILGTIFAAYLNGLLFLDTIGTALVALSLGPWWGASLGACTNLIISTYPGKEFVVNYLIVNVFCGFFWGYLGASRFGVFRGQFTYARILGSIVFLGIIGGAIASFMALVTTFKFQLFISSFDVTSLREWHPADKYYSWLLGSGYINKAGTIFQVVVRDIIALLPDKIVSIALSSVIIFYFFHDFVRVSMLRTMKTFERNNLWSYLVFLIIYMIAYLSMAFYGNITMDPTSTQIKYREVIPAQMLLWSIPLVWTAFKLLTRKIEATGNYLINNEIIFPNKVVWTVYRDILTILAAFFTILFAGKLQSTSQTEDVLLHMSNIFNDGWGMLGFFAVFGFLPIFGMRIFGVDPD